MTAAVYKMRARGDEGHSANSNKLRACMAVLSPKRQLSSKGFRTGNQSICCWLQRAVLALFCVSIFFAAQTSLGQEPYTHLAPKKVIVQHLHEHSGARGIHRSVFAVGAVDSVPVDGLLKSKDAELWKASRNGWEWLVRPLPLPKQLKRPWPTGLIHKRLKNLAPGEALNLCCTALGG